MELNLGYKCDQFKVQKATTNIETYIKLRACNL